MKERLLLLLLSSVVGRLAESGESGESTITLPPEADRDVFDDRQHLKSRCKILHSIGAFDSSWMPSFRLALRRSWLNEMQARREKRIRNTAKNMHMMTEAP